ncbi:putative mitochondrial phosphate carrier protein, mitochondrial precursor-like protein [Leptomonas pyrrhocoris]|uniref:Putative mitochondrial phosphate carrier protein, mitochondrial-like protein n=1 Tax=Leptomonas pyrrhocoris TaxID=157538 RepID=A0A0M9G239_LEPPY|nr:putative mitochondrial phosphate carrier protein, mitochondrial precursor-like protein [Leptomonas pyrrhocoris]KPA80785.1 putative mitochondrial phosphate carrier protein, mitochondrial precursor-like protein [Leptomonas pyrrhocoris]|eukprot:XP_015659224.1 putative mitochondrial phosphate carrier protein, mitochondrial precursor-like protein [Leptomonas pyrrhocoris]
MLTSTQAPTVTQLHGRNVIAAVCTPGHSPTESKDPQTGDSSAYSTNFPTSPAPASDGLTDVLAVKAPGAQPFITPMMRTRERTCLRRLVTAAALAAAVVLLGACCVWLSTADASVDPATGRVLPHTFQYFVYCFLGGVVAGTVHVFVTPIDVLKCRVQVGEYHSFTEGFVQLYRAEADGSVLRALPLFFRGWVPTVWGYCIQGALKFSLYEVLKYVLLFAPLARKHAADELRAPAEKPSPTLYDARVFQVMMFLLASSSAEVVADLGLAPWEAVKIRMQTSSTFPTSLHAALPRMWEAEGLHGFYKGLVPLWCRQVPYTMMKFASFEVIVVSLAAAFHAAGLLDRDHPSTMGTLLVSLMAGMLAGVLCGLVSHPADTVLSKLNQRSSAVVAVGGGSGDAGAPLLATAIAAARINSGVSGGIPGGSSGALHDVVVVVRELGWHGVWKGLAPRLLMVSAMTALQWVVYDGFKVLVGLPASGSVARH